jgi:flagellar basal-body rod protein FlgB
MTGTLTVRTLQAALRCTALRHQTIAQNLANVETPGYRRRILVFEEALAEALSGRNGTPSSPDRVQAQLKKFEPKLLEDRKSSLRADGNNVDIDEESVALAMNTGRHLALLEILNREFRQIRAAIRGGRG